jgi:hypothetical protein
MKPTIVLSVYIFCLSAGFFVGSSYADTEKLILPAFPTSRPAKIIVEGVGFEIGEMKEGCKAFMNRDYQWIEVSKPLTGLKFTRTRGGLPSRMTVRAISDGEIYTAWAVMQESGNPNLRGWELVDDLSFRYSVSDKPLLRVFRKSVKKGETVKIYPFAWTGTIVLAPHIDCKIVEPKPDFSKVPGTVVAHYPSYTGYYVGCPSIVVLRSGVYIASHSHFGNGESLMSVTRSDDGGKTWRRLTKIPYMHYATLFTHRKALYLIGVYKHSAAIMRSDDEGITWTTPKDSKSGLLLPDTNCHTAPTPVILHNRRLWRAMEEGDHPGERYPRKLPAFMMSVPENSNLLDASNWTFSNKVNSQGAQDYCPGFMEWLEGNAIVSPDGTIIDMLRVDEWEGRKAAIVKISSDGKTASFEPVAGFVPMPGGANKFSVRYDPVSKRYWSLANTVEEASRCGRMAAIVRNHLVLISSTDLKDWRNHKVVAYNPDPFNHGFQYADWQIDGEDIVAVVRTACDDGIDGAPNHHDANFLTFHRITNFRKLSFLNNR